MPDDDPQKEKKEMFGEGGRENPFLKWTRRVIIGLLALAVTVLLLWFVLITPQANQIRQLEGELSAAKDEVATLEASVDELQAVRPQREVLSLLVDASTARFELQRSRPDDAAAALLNTTRTLSLLGSELGEEYEDTIATLQARLDLAKEDLESAARFSALSDLEVFVNILLQLQRSLLSP